MTPKLLRALAILLALVVLALGYGYFSGRVLFLSADTNAKIDVNGAPVPGEMLVGRATAVITTREAGKHHSYQLFFEGDTDSTGDMGFVVDCGAWVAPHLFVLPETRSYPPCRIPNDLAGARPWPLIGKGESMQFNLQDHSVVAIRRGRYQT
jgi:hypothetical protein